MKATLLVTALSASFALISGGADARPQRGMSPAERAGYDYGSDAAYDFCRDIRRSEGFGRSHRSVTEDFKRGCRKGFDDFIDSNRTCRQRLRDQDRYTEMWDYRRETCS